MLGLIKNWRLILVGFGLILLPKKWDQTGLHGHLDESIEFFH
jgi:hypothetical protein